MRGFYVKGQGKASKCCNVHTKVFKTTMLGTFNVRVPSLDILKVQPSIVLEDKGYWFVILEKDDQQYPCWAIRDNESNQRVNILEILTKVHLPKALKSGDFNVHIPIKWNKYKIDDWARDQYWFHTFPFTPTQKADSAGLWDTINIIDWSGLKVLDYGCHYGYFSFEASKLGASVLGVDSNRKTLITAQIIRDNIIQQDVKFTNGHEFRKKAHDVILYLSVHHQIDPDYIQLNNLIKVLKYSARKFAFIELIMPPMFPKDKILTEVQIDKIVGGTVLKRYKHNVRGNRKVYFLEI